MTGGARRSAGSGETRRKSRGKKKAPFFSSPGGLQIVLRSGTFRELLLVSRQRTLLRHPGVPLA